MQARSLHEGSKGEEDEGGEDGQHAIHVAARQVLAMKGEGGREGEGEVNLLRSMERRKGMMGGKDARRKGAKEEGREGGREGGRATFGRASRPSCP